MGEQPVMCCSIRSVCTLGGCSIRSVCTLGGCSIRSTCTLGGCSIRSACTLGGCSIRSVCTLGAVPLGAFLLWVAVPLGAFVLWVIVVFSVTCYSCTHSSAENLKKNKQSVIPYTDFMMHLCLQIYMHQYCRYTMFWNSQRQSAHCTALYT